jgi:hypothetical protein
MSIPAEIQDQIIDNLAENLSKSELLQFRLVHRDWLPRVDSHAFHTLVMQALDGPSSLSFIKEPGRSIGSRVKRLIVLSTTTQWTTILHGHPPEGYSNDFILALPYVESLELIGLSPSLIDWVPCFPTIRHIEFQNTEIRASRLLDLVTTPTFLESVVHKLSGVCTKDDDRAMDVPQRMNGLCWPHLKRYETEVKEYSFNSFSPLESVLFPSNHDLFLPSLSHLSVHDIYNPPAAIRLLKFSSNSLRFLRVNFIQRVKLVKSREYI